MSKGCGEGSVPSHGPVQLWGNGSHVPAANATLFGGLNISQVPPNPPLLGFMGTTKARRMVVAPKG